MRWVLTERREIYSPSSMNLSTAQPAECFQYERPSMQPHALDTVSRVYTPAGIVRSLEELKVTALVRSTFVSVLSLARPPVAAFQTGEVPSLLAIDATLVNSASLNIATDGVSGLQFFEPQQVSFPMVWATAPGPHPVAGAARTQAAGEKSEGTHKSSDKGAHPRQRPAPGGRLAGAPKPALVCVRPTDRVCVRVQLRSS